ncbi:hypothetical protein BDV36DRAFT_308414 [Aspergillus pseudocaelatus]|uniref:Uncharacterized protein n=1 Tax=Aspergillus pseudocaelatus TaxID=1825620 RepID=A0ABQ6WNH3_9EURO|nr:hypothetical protein BDV36DRAFT_308414 [Aspergillus pseudocaelatus]
MPVTQFAKHVANIFLQDLDVPISAMPFLAADAAVKIIFPDLKFVMKILVDFLFSNRKMEFGFNPTPYRVVIEAVGGSDTFVDMVYNTIDPMIRALQGKVLTVDMLHNIRLKQAMAPRTWYEPNGGYLDFVTYIQSSEYWRPYVGQSNQPIERIPQHIRAIHNGSENSLHYYIIKQGNGSRRANFIRLWTIPFPPNTDKAVKMVFENFLEKIMCRAFQSLPAKTLELFFGPCPQGQYSGMGLNIVTPLLQGKELGPQIRHRLIQSLEDSSDPEIHNWPKIRNGLDYKTDRQSVKERLPYRKHMSVKDYYAALYQAIESNANLKESLLIQLDDNSWGTFEGELLDIDSWFQSISAKIRQQEPTCQAGFIAPVGTIEASVGIILDLTPLREYNVQDRTVSLPWGLRESGFNELNSIIWMHNLQKYVHIPGSFQVAPPRPIDRETLRTATRQLILGSRLRVIIICGDSAQEAALPDNAPLKKVTLSLAEMEHDAWIEISQHKITRIFIRAPAPLSELWTKYGKEAFQLTNVFRFVSAITDLTIFPSFYESALCVSLIVRKWDDENNSRIPKAEPTDLEPLLRVWLAAKGFSYESDLRRLAEAAGGSLRYGILVLSLILPRRKILHQAKRLPDSKIRRRGATDPEVLFKVKSLLKELSPQNEGVDASNDEIQECECDVDEIVCDDTFKIPTEEESASNTSQDLESLIQPFTNRLTLVLGHRYDGRWEPRYKSWTVFIRHGSISVKMEEEPKNGCWVQAELSPIGTRHPQVWAKATKDQDPGSRLAFRVSTRSADGHETGCFRANTLVDELNGDDYLQICQRPRRFVYIDPRNKSLLNSYPILQAFINGAYTDDKGMVDPRRKRARPPSNPVVDEKPVRKKSKPE